MSTPSARVLDFNPGALRHAVEGSKVEAQPAGIFADVADGIEAIHQLCNCAGFSERPRAFIFALASAAKTNGTDRVELFDAELADLQGCSERTVQRQRTDYKLEASRLRFGMIEIIDGDFDKSQNKYAPTLYRFAHPEAVEQIVASARTAEGWQESPRKSQRAAIKRAAKERYRLIPDARSKARKPRRNRLATAEIETCKKIIKTKLESLKDKTERLPEAVREQLMNPDESGDLLNWWLNVRAEMDAFFGIDGAQVTVPVEDDTHTRQLVGYPPVTVSGIPPVVADAPAEIGQEAEPVVAITDQEDTTSSPIRRPSPRGPRSRKGYSPPRSERPTSL